MSLKVPGIADQPGDATVDTPLPGRTRYAGRGPHSGSLGHLVGVPPSTFATVAETVGEMAADPRVWSVRSARPGARRSVHPPTAKAANRKGTTRALVILRRTARQPVRLPLPANSARTITVHYAHLRQHVSSTVVCPTWATIGRCEPSGCALIVARHDARRCVAARDDRRSVRTRGTRQPVQPPRRRTRSSP